MIAFQDSNSGQMSFQSLDKSSNVLEHDLVTRVPSCQAQNTSACTQSEIEHPYVAQYDETLAAQRPSADGNELPILRDFQSNVAAFWANTKH